MQNISVRRNNIVAVALAAVAFMVISPAAYAGPIYQTGFEGPTFTTGAISGQDGWSVFGPGISTVENFFVKTGSQAVFIDGGTATQSGPYHANTSTGPVIDVSADIALFTSSTQTGWQFAATGPGLIGYIGGIDIAAAGSNSTIFAITPGFQTIGTFARATAFNSSAWHHVDLLINMTTQTYSVSMDGAVLASNLAFCGSNSGCSGANVSTYGDFIFDSFGGVAHSNDSAYLDNLSIQTVPEPSSAVLLGIAGLVVAGLNLRQRVRR